ncbi:MAG: hypothetical protein JNK45_21285, partial [Myxococcales bacterium]|nr:hypothetical protein [Myxococcales bacterium]
MKTHTSKQALLLKVALVLCASSLVACGDADADDGGGSSTGNVDTTDAPTGNPTSSPTGDPTTNDPTTDDPTTTADTSTTDEPADTSAGSTTTGGDEFEFPEDPYSAYTQIDRHGAVEAGTAGILASQGLGFAPGSDISLRDEYNASNPVEDAAGMWLGEIADSVVFFHGALDDDLEALNLVPATVDQTVAQAGPVILPDTIKYDPSQPTSYPNGRNLEDPTVDITLAAVLLALGPEQPLSL